MFGIQWTQLIYFLQFLSMKLGAVNSHVNDGIAFQSKDVSLVDDSKQFISATELAAFWKRKLSSCILEKITELPGDHEKNHGKSCFCTCLSFWLNISNWPSCPNCSFLSCYYPMLRIPSFSFNVHNIDVWILKIYSWSIVLFSRCQTIHLDHWKGSWSRHAPKCLCKISHWNITSTDSIAILRSKWPEPTCIFILFYFCYLAVWSSLQDPALANSVEA